MTTTRPHHRHVTHAAHGAPTVAHAMQPAELRISADTMVDRALDLIRAADADHAILTSEDGRGVGVVRRAQLAPYLIRSWYTERTPIRNITHDRTPFARPAMSAVAAAASMRLHGLRIWAVADADGRVVGVLTPESLRAVLADAPAELTAVA
ncbi:CBS domain-containing protein [Streptomyces sp. SID3343]|uniref:CBS domain-containing protein n=1 Tax=Streptomyces sp. SID3343 TaxID=2690260 RepID=UPI001371EAE4|nr:CBS domain-containing protein [Streptomyces sp. SID3343]MYV97866.1 CBS domain-containing protein [Streptomyces sp. SID3343]